MSQKSSKFCWGCGNQLKTGQKFCTRCGKVVTSQIKPSQPVAEKKPDTTSNYGKIEPVQKSKEHIQEKIITKEISVDLSDLEKKMDDLNSLFSEKLEKLEYKVNDAFNVENKIIELKSKFDKLLPEISNMKEFKKLQNLDKLDKLDYLDNLYKLASAEDLR
ncbi:MAG: zinc-ribbon domain-containing protein, partial [Promethearchaeota archaeon]